MTRAKIRSQILNQLSHPGVLKQFINKGYASKEGIKQSSVDPVKLESMIYPPVLPVSALKFFSVISLNYGAFYVNLWNKSTSQCK